jgi:thioredoxin-like negative regulator of GroEL
MATTTRSSDDLFQQAICAWESAVTSGVKMQEESAKWTREMLSDTSSVSEWYNKGQAVAGETIGKAQENIDEAIRVINQQAEASVRLIQKAIEARQSEAGPDARARLADWWEAAMEAMRTNSQALLKANSRVLTTWSELARKINGETADAISRVAEKTAQHAEKMTQSATEHVAEMVKQASSA